MEPIAILTLFRPWSKCLGVVLASSCYDRDGNESANLLCGVLCSMGVALVRARPQAGQRAVLNPPHDGAQSTARCGHLGLVRCLGLQPDEDKRS